MNPIINLYNSNNWWYNVQNLTVLNPDGIAFQTGKAIQRVVYTKMSDDIGSDTYGQRTRCNFLLFKQLIPDNVIPQINSRVTDINGDYWYVYDIENKYFGNVIKLFTESRAGVGVTDQQYPQGFTTSTTTSSTTLAPGCQNDGAVNAGLTIDSQINMCAVDTNILYSWFAQNLALDLNETAAIQFEVTSVASGNLLDIVSDASGIVGGTAIAKINGVIIGGGNYAGTTLSYSTGVTVGDIIQFIFQNPTPIFANVIDLGIKLLPVATSTTITIIFILSN